MKKAVSSHTTVLGLSCGRCSHRFSFVVPVNPDVKTAPVESDVRCPQCGQGFPVFMLLLSMEYISDE